MSSDVVGSLFMMESDRAAPQTPPLMEKTHHRSLSGAPSNVRHRKTSSGFWNLDMEQLMAFPVEALPSDREIGLSDHIPVTLPDDMQDPACEKVDMDKQISTDPSSNIIESHSTMESDFDYGVDLQDGGSVSWPPTPSCGSHKAKMCDDYDSDQGSVIEDEEPSSCEYYSDEEDDDELKEWNMNLTLVDDESFAYPMSFDLDPPLSDFASDSVLPDYVGLDPDSALQSIPEDSEVCLDKVGNHVLEEEKPAVRVSLECIEYDAAGWSAKGNADRVQAETKTSSERIKAVDEQSERSNKTMRRPISHQEAVEAIIDRGTIHKSSQARNRHSKADMTDLFDPDEDIVVECEVVIPDMNSLVTPSNKNDRQMSDIIMSADDVKVSSGCCAGLKRLSTFGKARRRLEAIGRALKRHWPIITSAVVPLVLFFSCRGNK